MFRDLDFNYLPVPLSWLSRLRTRPPSLFLSDTLSSRRLAHTCTQTHQHTHALETVYRVSRITRCYGNSRATHQRNGERARERKKKQSSEIWGQDRWIDKGGENGERENGCSRKEEEKGWRNKIKEKEHRKQRGENEKRTNKSEENKGK